MTDAVYVPGGAARREFGTQFHELDCDGNVHELVAPWLEGGINVMFPVEVAHTDRYRIAREFGTHVAQRGAFNKRALIAGPAEIDAEFERLQPLLERGGLVPHTDHLVPPDVPFAHYLYYRRKKCACAGKSLEAIAWSEDGIVEALASDDYPYVLAVQWHPEEAAARDPRQQSLFDWLVDRAAGRRQSVRNQ